MRPNEVPHQLTGGWGSVVPHFYIGYCRESSESRRYSMNMRIMWHELGDISWNNNRQMSQQTATNWWGMIVGRVIRDGMARMRMIWGVPTSFIVRCISWDLLVFTGWKLTMNNHWRDYQYKFSDRWDTGWCKNTPRCDRLDTTNRWAILKEDSWGVTY